MYSSCLTKLFSSWHNTSHILKLYTTAATTTTTTTTNKQSIMIDITTIQGYNDFIKNSHNQRYNTIISPNVAQQSYIIDSKSHDVIATINESVRKHLLKNCYV